MVDPVTLVGAFALGFFAFAGGAFAMWLLVMWIERREEKVEAEYRNQMRSDYQALLHAEYERYDQLLARLDALRREGFDPPEPREEWEPDDSPDLPPEVLGALVRYGGRRDSETFDRLLAETRGRLLEDDASPEDVVKWLAEGTPPEEFDV